MKFLVLSSACRLHTAQRAIKQNQVTVQKIGKEIEEKLRTTAACTERVSPAALRLWVVYLLKTSTHTAIGSMKPTIGNMCFKHNRSPICLEVIKKRHFREAKLAHCFNVSRELIPTDEWEAFVKQFGLLEAERISINAVKNFFYIQPRLFHQLKSLNLKVNWHIRLTIKCKFFAWSCFILSQKKNTK